MVHMLEVQTLGCQHIQLQLGLSKAQCLKIFLSPLPHNLHAGPLPWFSFCPATGKHPEQTEQQLCKVMAMDQIL